MRASATHSSAPFFGLGFDMRSAVARAVSLTCVRVRPKVDGAPPRTDAGESFLWGYALMAALSREIRAG
ncbi:MAG: hypothetical protein ACOCWR_05885 [Oceanidesulfovibrio sp.]